MSDRYGVLDHGYLQVVDAWGSDESIVEAARMSTGKGFLGWGPRCEVCDEPAECSACDGEGCIDGQVANPCKKCGGRCRSWCLDGVEHKLTKPGDEKLLRFLFENGHHTPFEMGGLTFEVQAPIFVFREWHRHRVPFSYNEMSARYTPLPDVNYIPTVERLLLNSKTNKQAGTIKGSEELTEAMAEQFRDSLRRVYAQAEDVYQTALLHGVPKELARVHLPVGRYSRMRASANVRGWLNFLKLRMAQNAQWEIRQYANAVGAAVGDRFPRTWELFAGTLK
jgi:thymidylate synthase (FAD)